MSDFGERTDETLPLEAPEQAPAAALLLLPLVSERICSFVSLPYLRKSE